MNPVINCLFSNNVDLVEVVYFVYEPSKIGINMIRVQNNLQNWLHVPKKKKRAKTEYKETHLL